MKISLLIPILLPFASVAQRNISMSSPDKSIFFTFRVTKETPRYSVSYKGRPVMTNSSIGLSFQNTGPFQKDLRAGKPQFRAGEEKYELVVGKTSSVDERYNEVRIPLIQEAHQLSINLLVRIFNDGLAFRYEFPKQAQGGALVITEENTGFKFAADPRVMALLLSNYTTSHEGLYTDTFLRNIKEDTLMDMPALFELPGKIYASITEAALVNYAGMYLSRHGDALISRLSPLPHQSGIKVKTTLPAKSPWRVILLSDRLGSLYESNILTNLNEPLKITDPGWIRPGTTTFPWWNGNVTPDTLNAPGNNFVTNQYYIDFCARSHITYHSVVEYGLHQWYTDDGIGFQPGPHSDVTKPVPGLDMKAICDYAKSKGVGVRVWVHWAALYPKLDTAFAIFEKWGLSGMMVDFMDRDDQEMVNIQEEILQKAARHKLHIQFHGAYKPTGMHRTYPNEFTREGTMNYEVNKWGKNVTPAHDLNIVFTRMIAGSTDYHLGGFRAVPDSAFVVQYTRPLMKGTRCHMLAMYVVMENYLGMVCDYPAAYEGQPGFEFLQTVPTTWDETRVIDAQPHQHMIIARRKGKDWFVGALAGAGSEQVTIPLKFLPAGNFTATVYSDAPDVTMQPNHLVKEERDVQAKDILTLQLAAGGGAVIHICEAPL